MGKELGVAASQGMTVVVGYRSRQLGLVWYDGVTTTFVLGAAYWHYSTKALNAHKLDIKAVL